MKIFLVSILLLLLYSGLDPLWAGDKPKDENEFVSTSIVLKRSKLKAGGSGEILISLKPKKGIHINLIPKMDVKFETPVGLTFIDSLVIPVSKKTGFVDSEKPIKHAFSVSPNVIPGTINVKGMLTYYYCSDAEGWCSKFKQPINLKVIVTK